MLKESFILFTKLFFLLLNGNEGYCVIYDAAITLEGVIYMAVLITHLNDFEKVDDQVFDTPSVQ